jgi:hypothetical protein
MIKDALARLEDYENKHDPNKRRCITINILREILVALGKDDDLYPQISALIKHGEDIERRVGELENKMGHLVPYPVAKVKVVHDRCICGDRECQDYRPSPEVKEEKPFTNPTCGGDGNPFPYTKSCAKSEVVGYVKPSGVKTEQTLDKDRELDRILHDTAMSTTGKHLMIVDLFRSNKSTDKVETCSCCGGKQVYIRGRYPNTDNRLVCPTCATERLEQIQTIADHSYGKSWQASIE